jgi:toxin-antitoxin system PIN domain toxin
VILIDTNILLYAEDEASTYNKKARGWLDNQLSGSSIVCLCWQVINAFIRIGTNHRVFEKPLALKEAVNRVKTWLDQPCVRIIQPTENHWTIFKEMLVSGQAAGNLVSDAHLAALAYEYGCTLFSTDTDFSRFPHVKWKNPLRISLQ